MAATPVDTAITIDVLANDALAPDALHVITQINGLDIVEGGSVGVGEGVTVTLSEGLLVVDGSASALAGLLDGETGSSSFTYTVTDDAGIVSTANVDVTFSGVNSPEEDVTLADIAATLPTTADRQARDESTSEDNAGDAFTVQVSNGNETVDGIFENAYSLSFFVGQATTEGDNDLSIAPSLATNVFIADDDFVPESFRGDVGVGINGESAVDNLDLINYILNQDFEATDNGDGDGNTYTDAEIQGAIWALTDGQDISTSLSADGIVVQGVGTNANAQEILDLALANGEGFEADPGAGDIVGVLLDPQGEKGVGSPIILALDLDDDLG